jgi:hypothetical protein
MTQANTSVQRKSPTQGWGHAQFYRAEENDQPALAFYEASDAPRIDEVRLTFPTLNLAFNEVEW